MRIEAYNREYVFEDEWSFTEEADVDISEGGEVLVVRDPGNEGTSDKPFVLVLNLREYACVQTVSEADEE